MTTLFAWRYFRSKKTTNAINIIAWISMVAIALVTAALIIILSVFNGFEDLVKSLYGDFYADIKITTNKGKWIREGGNLAQKIAAINGIKQAESIVEERAILLDQEDKSIVWLKGVSPEYINASGVPAHLLHGKFETGSVDNPAVVLGSGVENALQVTAGQSIFPLTIYLPNRKAVSLSDPLEAMRSANAIPSGAFAIQQDFDNQYAFTNRQFMQYMLDLTSNEATAIEVYVKKNANIDRIQKSIETLLGEDYDIKNRYEQNQNLYAAMQAERLIIYAVAILILIIAAFNIISSLTMTVLEKQQDIAVLQAMGTTGKTVSTIFLKLGAILAGLGGTIGFIMGVLICVGQQQFHWIKLGGQSFIIDYYPVSMQLSDFIFVGIIILVIAFFSGWLPSRKAAKTAYSLKS
ncbi:MAG: FtsX-like permease family protein [Bacteroidota bacterium]